MSQLEPTPAIEETPLYDRLMFFRELGDKLEERTASLLEGHNIDANLFQYFESLRALTTSPSLQSSVTLPTYNRREKAGTQLCRRALARSILVVFNGLKPVQNTVCAMKAICRRFEKENNDNEESRRVATLELQDRKQEWEIKMDDFNKRAETLKAKLKNSSELVQSNLDLHVDLLPECVKDWSVVDHKNSGMRHHLAGYLDTLKKMKEDCLAKEEKMNSYIEGIVFKETISFDKTIYKNAFDQCRAFIELLDRIVEEWRNASFRGNNVIQYVLTATKFVEKEKTKAEILAEMCIDICESKIEQVFRFQKDTRSAECLTVVREGFEVLDLESELLLEIEKTYDELVESDTIFQVSTSAGHSAGHSSGHSAKEDEEKKEEEKGNVEE